MGKGRAGHGPLNELEPRFRAKRETRGTSQLAVDDSVGNESRKAVL